MMLQIWTKETFRLRMSHSMLHVRWSATLRRWQGGAGRWRWPRPKPIYIWDRSGSWTVRGQVNVSWMLSGSNIVFCDRPLRGSPILLGRACMPGISCYTIHPWPQEWCAVCGLDPVLGSGRPGTSWTSWRSSNEINMQRRRTDRTLRYATRTSSLIIDSNSA